MCTVKHIQWDCFNVEVTGLIQNKNNKISFANTKNNNTVKPKKTQPNKNEKNLFKLVSDLALVIFIGNYTWLFFFLLTSRNKKFSALDKSYSKFIFISLI